MRILFFFSLLLVLSPFSSQAQSTKVKTVKVTDNIYMLQGRGGNIGVSLDPDGVLMIDDQFANATPDILDAVKQLSDKPIKYLVNTHHHGDHTGGNKNMIDNGTSIFAHENAYKRIFEDVYAEANKEKESNYRKLKEQAKKNRK